MLEPVGRGHQLFQGQPGWDAQAVIGAMGVGVEDIREDRQLEFHALRAGPFALLYDDAVLHHDVSFAEPVADIGESLRCEAAGRAECHEEGMSPDI